MYRVYKKRVNLIKMTNPQKLPVIMSSYHEDIMTLGLPDKYELKVGDS